MKKIILLFLIVLSGCKCIVGQIPPQNIYAGADCSALLPDYRNKVNISENCDIASFTQVPAPGFMLTATNKVTTVVIKATDVSGNYSQVSFSVFLLDTIKPKLTVDPSLIAYQMEQIDDIYNFGDRLIMYGFENLNMTFPIDSFPGLRDVWKFDTYFKDIMLTYTSPGHAVTGYGSRIHTFISSNDTVIITRK